MGPQTLTPTLSVCLTVYLGSTHPSLPPGASLLHTTDSPGQKTWQESDLNGWGPMGLSEASMVRSTFSLQMKAMCTKKRKQC